jgi:tripartite-type tricarboxylate transporter receptor subunit TctC
VQTLRNVFHRLRTVLDSILQSLGQPLIVENVSGAAGTIGVGRAERAAPDGYTMSIGHWSTHVINGALYPLSEEGR